MFDQKLMTIDFGILFCRRFASIALTEFCISSFFLNKKKHFQRFAL